MPKIISNPFKLRTANALAQCDICGAVSAYDILDIIIQTDRTCQCGGKLVLYSPAIIPLSGDN